MKPIFDAVLSIPDEVDRAMQELAPHERVVVENWQGDVHETWDHLREKGFDKNHKLSKYSIKRMSTDIKIVRAIRIYNQDTDPGVLTKKEREQFLSSVIMDESQRTSDKLKALELLGKMHSDYKIEVEMSASSDLAKAIAEARGRANEIETTVTVLPEREEEDPFG